MTQATFATRILARNSLRALGMELKHKGTFSDQYREYWGFTQKSGRKDVMLDHSATITKIGREFYVSNFAA